MRRASSCSPHRCPHIELLIGSRHFQKPAFELASLFVSSPLLSILCSRHFVWACGVGGLPRRCPISSIGRLSSSVRCLSLCIRHAWRDRKAPPRPYDAKCGCFVLALLESEVFTSGGDPSLAISGYLSVLRYTAIPLYRFATLRMALLRDLLISRSRGLVSHTPSVQCSAMSRQSRVFCARDFQSCEYFVSCVRIVSGQRLNRAAYTSPV